jgi:HAD superfamily hydrolase (TIGR01509 family)
MDGVLIDAREWHYGALNTALEVFGFNINQELHISKLNGLPTREKLEYLSQNENLPRNLHPLISDLKQDYTKRLAAQNCRPNQNHLSMLSQLRKRMMPMGVATNSIKETTHMMLNLAGVIDYMEIVLTNQDVQRAKPHPEIYLEASRRLGFDPSAILVVEDHDYGVSAAKAAGCQVLQINSPQDLNWVLLEKALTDAK